MDRAVYTIQVLQSMVILKKNIHSAYLNDFKDSSIDSV